MRMCDRGVQMLITTVGAFAAFSLMTIAVGTDYWLYSRGVCRTKSTGDNDTSRKNEEVMTHSGLWRTCCLEGTDRPPAAPPPPAARRGPAQPRSSGEGGGAPGPPAPGPAPPGRSSPGRRPLPTQEGHGGGPARPGGNFLGGSRTRRTRGAGGGGERGWLRAAAVPAPSGAVRVRVRVPAVSAARLGLSGHRSRSGPRGSPWRGSVGGHVPAAGPQRGLCRHRVQPAVLQPGPSDVPALPLGAAERGKASCCRPTAASPSVPRGLRPTPRLGCPTARLLRHGCPTAGLPPARPRSFAPLPWPCCSSTPLERLLRWSCSTDPCLGGGCSPKFLAEIYTSNSRQGLTASLSGAWVLVPVQQKMADGITLGVKF